MGLPIPISGLTTVGLPIPTSGLVTVGLPIPMVGLATIGLTRVIVGLPTVGLVTRRIAGLATVGLDTRVIGLTRRTVGLLMDGDTTGLTTGDTTGDTTGLTTGDTTGETMGLDARRTVGDTPDTRPIPATVPAYTGLARAGDGVRSRGGPVTKRNPPTPVSRPRATSSDIFPISVPAIRSYPLSNFPIFRWSKSRRIPAGIAAICLYPSVMR